MEQLTCSKLGEEYVKAIYCHPAYLSLHDAEHIMQKARLDETQAGIRIAGRSINTFRYHSKDGRKQRRTEEPLNESERGE